MALDKEEASKRGFAGLSSMVSDVDATVDSAKATAGHTIEELSLHRQTAEVQQSNAGGTPAYMPSGQHTSGSSAGKWMLGIGVVLGVFWLVSTNSETNKKTATSATSSASRSPATNTPTSPSPTRQVAPSPPTALPEERPPMGSNSLLSTAQIRYCLAEDIRLNAGKSVVNQYLDIEVDRYNALASDYNSRCGQFRYRRGTLEPIRAEVETRRASLEAEGVARFRRL
jgi:hypothetical protein